MAKGTLGIIGFGNMGSAIIGGLIQSNVYMPSDIHIFDVDSAKLAKAKKDGHFIHSSMAELGESSEIIIIAVKPGDVIKALSGLKGSSGIELIISVAAGISTAEIESAAGDIPVIRVMPNTPCMVGAGAIVISRGKKAGDKHIKKAKTIMEATGVVCELPEKHMDAVTGLSGSGPAYVSLMIESLADGGVKMGLPRDTALKLAAQTVFGTAKMILEANIHPSKLKEMVTSPGGTTIEGIAALEAGAFRSTVMEAVEAAALRSEELGS
ncbi:pyrroline-5-carboxylate reductase [Candidatus Latescibacterota bacterium]